MRELDNNGEIFIIFDEEIDELSGMKCSYGFVLKEI